MISEREGYGGEIPPVRFVLMFLDSKSLRGRPDILVLGLPERKSTLLRTLNTFDWKIKNYTEYVYILIGFSMQILAPIQF
jgi:hypothetical protein